MGFASFGRGFAWALVGMGEGRHVKRVYRAEALAHRPEETEYRVMCRDDGCVRLAFLGDWARAVYYYHRCYGALSVEEVSWRKSRCLRQSEGRGDLVLSYAARSCPSYRSRSRPVRGNAHSFCSLLPQYIFLHCPQPAQSYYQTRSHRRCRNETCICSLFEGIGGVVRAVESTRPKDDQRYCHPAHGGDGLPSTLLGSLMHPGGSMVSPGT